MSHRSLVPGVGLRVAGERRGHRRRALGIVSLILVLLVGTAYVTGAPSTVLYTVNIAANPAGLVIDDLTHHAFVYSRSGVVTMFEVESGKVLKRIPAEANLVWQPLQLDERAGLIFVAGHRAGMEVLSTRTGALLHTFPALPTSYNMAIDERTGEYLLADVNGRVVQDYGLDGHLRHTTRVDGYPTAITIDPLTGHAFVALDAGSLVSIDERTGRIRWRAPIGSGGLSIAVDSLYQRVAVMSIGLVSAVTLLNARTGALVQSYVFRSESISMALDTRTHQTFVTDQERASVSIIDTRSGLRQQSIALAQPPLFVTDGGADRLLVGGFPPFPDGLHPMTLIPFLRVPFQGSNHITTTVAVLDVQTGKVRGTLQLDGTARAIGTDAAQGRLLIALGDGDASSIVAFDTHRLP